MQANYRSPALWDVWGWFEAVESLLADHHKTCIGVSVGKSQDPQSPPKCSSPAIQALFLRRDLDRGNFTLDDSQVDAHLQIISTIRDGQEFVVLVQGWDIVKNTDTGRQRALLYVSREESLAIEIKQPTPCRSKRKTQPQDRFV
jgi:hypothetical protein